MTASPSFVTVFWPDTSLKIATRIGIWTEIALYVNHSLTGVSPPLQLLTFRIKTSRDNHASVGKVSVLKE